MIHGQDPDTVNPLPGWSVSCETSDGGPAVLLAVLGTLRLRVAEQLIPIGSGSRSEQLLVCLALRRHHRTARSELLESVWPGADTLLAGQSMNSLTHQLNRSVERLSDGIPLIVHEAGYYRLNPSAEVAVDVDLFDHWQNRGMRLLSAGQVDGGLEWCERAVDLYRGELCAGARIDIVSERERLRVAYLDLLACLADQYFRVGDAAKSLAFVQRLLEVDYCREDAHRQAMRCYMRLGRRSQALRQYQLCCRALAEEFDAVAEPETVALHQLIQHNPAALV
jgi:DNA-binding SARP family transcriptional activator